MSTNTAIATKVTAAAAVYFAALGYLSWFLKHLISSRKFWAQRSDYWKEQCFWWMEQCKTLEESNDWLEQQLHIEQKLTAKLRSKAGTNILQE